MKNTILPATILSTLLAFTVCRVAAHPDGHVAESKKAPAAPATAHGHEHKTKVPATVAEIWAAIEKQQQRLDKVVADKKLADAHDHAFAIRDLVKSLAGKVADAKKADTELAAQQIASLAADIDKAAAAGAQKTTEANVKAMAAAIRAFATKVQPTKS